jgi:hypothetical protein
MGPGSRKKHCVFNLRNSARPLSTGLLLAVALRPGNARANTAADHINVLTQAITKITTTHRRKLLAG